MKWSWPLLSVAIFAFAGCGHKNSPAQNAGSLADLNRALPVVAMHLGTASVSTNDLATFLALTGKTLPVPPPGKRLELDPGRHQFVFVDQTAGD